jgi:hypothetical protein
LGKGYVIYVDTTEGTKRFGKDNIKTELANIQGYYKRACRKSFGPPGGRDTLLAPINKTCSKPVAPSSG